MADNYNQFVKFYNVEELCADKIAKINKLFPRITFSIGTFYRFFILQVLSSDIERAIYLDTDIIVNLDIEELWKIELGDKPLAVIPEILNGMATHTFFALCRDGIIEPEIYFNAGVLLMNLKVLRNKEKIIEKGLNFIAKRNGYFDQDTLNYCFAKNALKLPVKFNRFVWSTRKETKLPQRKIYHYTTSKAINFDMSDVFNRLWMGYFAKTPWFNAEVIGNLYESFKQIKYNAEELVLKVSKAVSGKARVFFVEPKKVAEMKKVFAIGDDEEIIIAENEASIQKLIDTMKESHAKKIFFITTETFMKERFPLNRLIKAGFVQDKDFLKAWELLSERNGGWFDFRPLIRAM